MTNAELEIKAWAGPGTLPHCPSQVVSLPLAVQCPWQPAGVGAPVLVEQQSDITLSILHIFCVSLLIHLFISLVLTTALLS
jgi:hypothetical protein